MVETEQVQDRRVEVVDVDFVLNGFVAVIVGQAVGEAALHAAAGHPHGEGFVVVVAPIVALRVRGAAKFAAPDHQRVLEQPALLEIGEQRGDRLVHRAAVCSERRGEVEVLVPVSVRDFHKAHAGLDQAPSQQTFPPEVIGAPVRALPTPFAAWPVGDAIQFFCCLALAGEVHHTRHFLLHPEGELVALDHPLDVGIQTVDPQRLAVKRLQQVEFGALNLRAERRVEVADFRTGDWSIVGADARALIDRGEKRRAIVLRTAGSRRRRQRDEAGEVFVFGAEAVKRPCTERWPDELKRAGVHLQEGLRMRGQVGLHRAQQAEVVGMVRDIREELGNPEPALSVLRKLPFRAEQLGAGTYRRRARFGSELGLVIEGIDVRRPAAHAEKDDALRPRREVRRLGREWPSRNCGGSRGRGTRGQARKGKVAEAARK